MSDLLSGLGATVVATGVGLATFYLVRLFLAREPLGDARPSADAVVAPPPEPEALDLFAEGSRLMREGRRAEALAAWAKAFERDPKNFVIRKQIWRALYPGRFGDPIDLAWQKEQIAREDELGFTAANPRLSP